MNGKFNLANSKAPLGANEQDHRIANSLASISSMVRLKAGQASAEEGRRFLLEVAGRIEVVARLHRLLASVGSAGVPLGPFLSSTCAAMSETGGHDDHVHFTIDCSKDLTLLPEITLVVGRLTSELFCNSVKYAHPAGVPTIIKVACRDDGEGMLAFTFEDDGVGFPENFDPATHEGLGMKIIALLAAQIRGRFEWHDLGIGLRFACRFPADPRPRGTT